MYSKVFDNNIVIFLLEMMLLHIQIKFYIIENLLLSSYHFLLT